MNDSAHIAHIQHLIAENDDCSAAFDDLFKLMSANLLAFAYTIVHNKTDANEVVISVFTSVWKKRKTIDQVQNLKLYLYTATRNFAINKLRQQKQNPTLGLEEMHLEPSTIVVNAEQLLEQKQLKELLQVAIDELPPKCKVIFKLVKEDGLKQQEVAELLHISLKTVENQLAIALRKLGSRLKKYAYLTKY